jgi:hypothetical protein
LELCHRVAEYILRLTTACGGEYFNPKWRKDGDDREQYIMRIFLVIIMVMK